MRKRKMKRAKYRKLPRTLRTAIVRRVLRNEHPRYMAPRIALFKSLSRKRVVSRKLQIGVDKVNFYGIGLRHRSRPRIKRRLRFQYSLRQKLHILMHYLRVRNFIFLRLLKLTSRLKRLIFLSAVRVGYSSS